jgi:hypothetical protein
MKGLKKEEGIALVITLLIMTLLLVMGTAFLSISSTETLISINERNRFQAFHVAEGGSERAIAELNINETYTGTGGEQSLGFGTYEATVTPLSTPLSGVVDPVDPMQITSTGYVPNKTVSNKAMTQVEVAVYRGSPFQIGLLGLSLVELEDRVVVDSYDSALGEYDPMAAGSEGHIQSNGDITLLTNNTVNGNALAGGTVTLGFGSTITGTATEGVPSATIVTDISYPAYNSDTAGISPPGAYDTSTYDLTVNPGQTVTLDPGTYSFNRITLKTGAKLAITGPVVIYMTGRFYAQNGVVVNTSKIPANLMIISSMSGSDAITTEEPGSGEFYGGIYALNGEVEFNDGGWKIYGAIVADEIDIEDDARFHYDVALTKPSLPAGKFRPAAGTWRELFP